MSSLEAAEMLASARLDPDETDRADVRHALMMSMLVRLNARPRRGQRLPGPLEFLSELPWREEYKPPRPQTPAELQQKIRAAMTTLGLKPVKIPARKAD